MKTNKIKRNLDLNLNENLRLLYHYLTAQKTTGFTKCSKYQFA